MKFGSVCSGIEAASVAFEPLGWKAAWFSEIEAFPCAVLAHHYPKVPNLGDMTTIAARIRSGEVEAPDVFVGGTPCQAFSVAGLRNSLDDARGNLSLVFCEIANEIDTARSVLGLEPAIVFWENVPGVLSTKDNAFGCFLGALAGEDDPLVAPGGKWTNAGCVFSPQRAVAWRVLDAQYFGVAQRRRRVFVVASARAGFNPAEILFEFDGVRRDTAPRRQAGKNTTRGVEFGPSGGRFTDVNPTLDAGAADGPIRNQLAGAVLNMQVAGTIEASMGRSRGAGISPAALVTTHRMLALGEYVDDESASTIKARDYKDATDLVVQPIGIFQDSEFGVKQYDSAGMLRAGRIPEHQMVIQPIAYGIRTAQTSSNGWGIQEEVTHTLDGAMGIAIAFSRIDDGSDAKVELSPTMQIGGNAGGTLAIALAQAHVPSVAYTTKLHNTTSNNAGKIFEERTACLDANSPPPALLTATQVRRLTPKECARLQGFPDDYLDITFRKKPAADGPKYKALGNSWAVPNVRWIASRIEAVESVRGQV